MSIVALSALAGLALKVIGAVVVPLVGNAVQRRLASGRRRDVALLVAHLAQEALSAAMRQKGVPSNEAAQLEEAVKDLVDRLIGAGVDPAKAVDMAPRALAAAQASEAAMVEARRAARQKLLGDSNERAQ